MSVLLVDYTRIIRQEHGWQAPVLTALAERSKPIMFQLCESPRKTYSMYDRRRQLVTSDRVALCEVSIEFFTRK